MSAGVGGVSEGSLVGEPKHDSIREQDNWRTRENITNIHGNNIHVTIMQQYGIMLQMCIHYENC